MSQQTETRELTPAAKADRDEFESIFDRGNCACHLSPPCSSCTHPGNPRNQDEDDSCWQPATPVIGDAREAVCAAVAEALGDAYDCTRVWDAWSVGTMSADDFKLISDDAERVAEIADAAISALRAAPPAPVGGVDERCAFEAFCRSYFAGESPTSKGLTLNAQNRRVQDCQSAWSAALAWKSASLTNEGGREWEPPALMQNGDTKRDPELRKRLDRWSKEQNKKVATVIDRIFGEPPAINEGGSEPVRRFDLDEDGSMDEFPDGRWVRYEDHCKAAAPQPSAKALTDEQIEDLLMPLLRQYLGGNLLHQATYSDGWSERPTTAMRNLARALLAAEQPSTEQADEDAYVIDRLSKLLAGVAIALKGDEQPLMRHSYHDLPDLAAALKLELDLYRANAEQPSEPGSSCDPADVCAGCRCKYGACYRAPDQAEQPSEDKCNTPAARDVLAERRRQVESEGWTPGHDDEHTEGEMAGAAACYAATAAGVPYAGEAHPWWPWCNDWWKPTTPRRDLVKAGALILAEIERLDRAAIAKGEGK